MTTDLGFDSYLICATARSGSTLLCSLLDSSGVAGHPASYFIRRGLQEYAEYWGIPHDGRIDDAYVAATLTAGRTDNGIFACRVMGETMPELIKDLTAMSGPGATDLELLTERFGRLRFVHLRRVDVVAQAASWARSLQTHYWHPGEEMVPGGQDPHYDEGLLDELVVRIQTLEADWAAWFAEQGVAPYEVTYEELAADPPGTAHGVLDHLGLQLAPDQQLTSPHRRQADQINADWIRRFTSRPGSDQS